MNKSWIHIYRFVYIFLRIIFWFPVRGCYELSKYLIVDGSVSSFVCTVMLGLKSETSGIGILVEKIRLQKIKKITNTYRKNSKIRTSIFRNNCLFETTLGQLMIFMLLQVVFLHTFVSYLLNEVKPVYITALIFLQVFSLYICVLCVKGSYTSLL